VTAEPALSPAADDLVATVNLQLGPRPKLKNIPRMAAALDTVVVLLMEKEDAATLVARWEATGVEVLHVDYGIRRDGDHAAIVEATAEAVAARLAAGRRVHIHGAAGLHRTGRVAYASLRRLGLSRDDAIAEIRRIRPVTGDAIATLVAKDSGSVEP